MADRGAGPIGPVERVGPVGMGAFLGFFAAPAFAMVLFALVIPGRVSYREIGVVLLAAVLMGATVGAVLGGLAGTVRFDPEARTRLLSGAFVSLAGGLLAPAAEPDRPVLAGLAGLTLGWMAGRLFGIVLAPGERPPIDDDPLAPFRDDELDPP